MLFKASIQVMPIKGLLDPQGKAVTASMSNLGLSEVTNVRIGKHITLKVEADNEAALKRIQESFRAVILAAAPNVALPF